MEWVETTGKTVEEAKERALDRLGVLAEDAEFEVLEEPKQGLFGRVRGEARVRARVRPTQARQKVDRRDRRRSDKTGDKTSGKGAAKDGRRESGQGRAASGQRTTGDGTTSARQGAAQQPRQRSPKPAAHTAESAAVGANSATGTRSGAGGQTGRHSNKGAGTDVVEKEQMVDARQVGQEAQRFMEGLVSSFGLTGTVELLENGDDLEVRVHGQELGLLVGPRGTTLQAVQDLARVASQRRLGDHDTRLRLDIGGYRERRTLALGKFALQMAEEVKTSGVARVLEPMGSADRKVIHDTLSSVEGIETRSEGDDPFRRVVIAPANG